MPSKKKRRSSWVAACVFSPLSEASEPQSNAIDNNKMNHVQTSRESSPPASSGLHVQDDFFTFHRNEESGASFGGLAVTGGLTGTLAVGASIIAGWALGAAGLSVAWLLLLLAFVLVKCKSQLALVANKAKWREMQRVRMQRTLANSESAEWLNVLLHRWWMCSGESMYRILRIKIEPLLNEIKPPFVERIQLNEFTFGSETPCIQNVRSFDVISGKRQAATASSGTPQVLNVSSNGSSQIQLEVAVLLNSEQFRMVFCARLFGKGVGMDVDVAMEKLYIFGKLSVTISFDLSTPFPHIASAAVSFVEKPDVWFTIKVMKSLQMMEVPVLKTWLHSVVVDALESAMVNPGHVTFHPCGVKVPASAPTPDGGEQGAFTAPAHGVLIVTLCSLPDYIDDGEQKRMVLRLGEQTWRTGAITPGWTETPYFLISSLQKDRLNVKLKSKRLVTSATLAQYEMSLDDYNLHSTKSVETHLQKSNPRLSQIPSISLRLEYIALPFFDIDSPAPPTTPGISSSIVSGVLTIVIHSAHDLSANDTNLPNPYCIVFNNRKKVKSTSYVINSVNPEWQTICQLLVPDYSLTSLSFVVCSWNLKKMTDDEMLGVGVFNIAKNYVYAKGKEIPLSGNPGASLKISYYFQPVPRMCGETSAQYNVDEDSRVKKTSSSWMNQAKNLLGRGDQEAQSGQSGNDIANMVISGVGIMEVTLIAARELMPMDMNGFSDPYCQLNVNTECKYKSAVKKKTLNPVWDETAIMPMPRKGETLDVMVWDHDTFGMKDFLGNITFTLDEIRQVSIQEDSAWYTLLGVRSGQIQLQIRIISEDSSYERGSTQNCQVGVSESTESSPLSSVRRVSLERSRVRLGVHVPPPTPPRTVSIPRPPALGRDARDSPEHTLPLVTITASPSLTRASSQASSHPNVTSLPPSPTNETSDVTKKSQETTGFRSMRLKVSRSLRLRRFKSEVNVRESEETINRGVQEDSDVLNHAVSQPNINKLQAIRPSELNLAGRPDTYTGVVGKVLQAQGLHVALVSHLYVRIKLLGCDKQGVGKTLAKSHVIPAVPNPQFELDFQVSSPESVPRQAAFLFEIRSSSKEIVASRRVTLQHLLPGDLKETHTWLALNNGATLEVSIGHGHVLKKKSKKLFRSWSVHRIGKI